MLTRNHRYSKGVGGKVIDPMYIGDNVVTRDPTMKPLDVAPRIYIFTRRGNALVFSRILVCNPLRPSHHNFPEIET